MYSIFLTAKMWNPIGAQLFQACNTSMTAACFRLKVHIRNVYDTVASYHTLLISTFSFDLREGWSKPGLFRLFRSALTVFFFLRQVWSSKRVRDYICAYFFSVKFGNSVSCYPEGPTHWQMSARQDMVHFGIVSLVFCQISRSPDLLTSWRWKWRGSFCSSLGCHKMFQTIIPLMNTMSQF